MLYYAPIKNYTLQKLLIAWGHFQAVTSSAKAGLKTGKCNLNYKIVDLHRKQAWKETRGRVTGDFLGLPSVIRQARAGQP